MPRLAPGRSLLAAPLTVRRLTVCRAPARFTVRRAPARFVVAAAARLTAAALILLVAARPAAAQPAGNLTLDPFRPPIDAHGYLTVNGSQSLSHRELSFGLGALGWGHRLLTLDGAGNAYAIDDVITATLVAAVGLRVGPAALELGASLPLAIVAGSRGMTTTADGRTYRVDGQGVGDLGLHVKATLLRPRRGRPLGVAALAGVYLPTASTRDRFLGEAQVVPQLVGIADVELGRLRLAINGGVRLRRTTTFTNSDPGPDGAPVTGRSITASSELPFGVAAAYAVARQRLELIGEVFGAVPLGAHEAYQPLEAVAGLKVYLAQSSYLSLGVGRGLVGAGGRGAVRGGAVGLGRATHEGFSADSAGLGAGWASAPGSGSGLRSTLRANGSSGCAGGAIPLEAAM